MPRLFRFLEPTFFAGLIDDPCLAIRDRPIHQSILLDCGALHHVAKREMKPVRAIFVSHAHMECRNDLLHTALRTLLGKKESSQAEGDARLDSSDRSYCPS